MNQRPRSQASLSETFQHLPRAWYGYVALVGLLALFGAAGPAWAIVVATVITIPVGVGALMASFACVIFFKIVFTGFGVSFMAHHAWNPTWWVLTFKILVTALYVLAAIANATLIQRAIEQPS